MRPRDQLPRVVGKLADVVEAFFAVHPAGARFHLDDLEGYVREHGAGAPGSPSRVMRALRAAGRIGYRLVSRSESLYEVERPTLDEPTQRELLK